MPTKHRSGTSLYRNLAMSFAALTTLLIVVIVYFTLVEARITVIPRVQTLPLQASITVAAPASEAATDTLPGTVIERDETQTVTATASRIREEEGKSRGTVRIMNKTTAAQALIATTRFVSVPEGRGDGVLYRLEKPVRVPANGEVSATIVADQAGKAQEVAATTWTIPGLSAAQQKLITGISDAPMVGGTRVVSKLTQEDATAAKQAASTALEERVRKELAGDRTDVRVLVTIEPVTSTLSHPVNADVETFTASVTAHVRGIVVGTSALHTWINRELAVALPDDQRLLPIDESALTIEVAIVKGSTATARLSVKGEGRAVLRTTSPLFDRQRFLGRTPDEVRQILEANRGVARATVQLSPRFLKRLPRIPDHISIVIEEPK